MSMAQAAGHAYALLADGSTVEIRPAGPADFGAVKAMHEAMSPDNIYMRFFSLSKLAAETEARRICRDPAARPCGAAGAVGRRGSGLRQLRGAQRTSGPGDVAEVAFAVADHMHHSGIATLLLEHLVSLARSYQITVFTAQTLSENTADAQGVRRCRPAGPASLSRTGSMSMTIPLPTPERWNRPGQLPGTPWPSGRRLRGHRQPPARACPRVGRGHRREPAPGHGRPGDPGQHPHRRVRGPAVRGQPARPADQRRAVPGLGGRPARARRPGRDRGPARGGAGRGRAVRPARRTVPGGDHVRPRCRRLRRPARGVPPARHAAGRPELLRRGRARHRPGCHVRRPAPAARRGRADPAVRRPGLRHGRPAVPARHRDLLVRVGR